jgi:hypothetical protein
VPKKRDRKLKPGEKDFIHLEMKMFALKTCAMELQLVNVRLENARTHIHKHTTCKLLEVYNWLLDILRVYFLQTHDHSHAMEEKDKELNW